MSERTKRNRVGAALCFLALPLGIAVLVWLDGGSRTSTPAPREAPSGREASAEPLCLRETPSRESGRYNHFMKWRVIEGVESCLANPISRALAGQAQVDQMADAVALVKRIKVGSPYRCPELTDAQVRELWSVLEAVYNAC